MSTLTPTAGAVGFHELPLTALHPSPLNPRKRVTGLEDLAASIREVGILEPLLVRRRADTDDAYEVIAGGRRLEAARQAGVVLATCLVRELDDAHALELAIIENNQRGDIHPLEEAEAFQRLATLDRGYTPEAIAAKIGRPVGYVKARLKLLELGKPAREAFANDEIALGHAQLLARLTPAQQKGALERCRDRVLDYDTGKSTFEMAKISHLQDYIREYVPLDLQAPETQEEFPELVTAVAHAAATGATALMLDDNWGYGTPKAGAAVTRDQWTEVNKTEPHARFGVIVRGRRRGRTLWVRLKADDPKPVRQASTTRTARTPKTPAQKAAEKKAREAEQKRVAEAKAKEAREQRVTTAALEQVVDDLDVSELTSAAALRLIATAVNGADFGPPVVAAIAKRLKVPTAVFDWNGAKARLKLDAPTLARVVAVMLLGTVTDHGHAATAAAFDVFGVSLKAIDKKLAAEDAAAGAAPAKAPANDDTKGAGIRKTAGRKAAKKR